MFTLTIETGGAAFERDQLAEELSTILRRVAGTLTCLTLGNPDAGSIRDTNGNTVGAWSFSGEPDTDALELSVVWEDDWSLGTSHYVEYGEAYTDAEGNPDEPDTCERAYVEDQNGDVWASLHCIDGADDAYRAEIAGQLLEEAREAVAEAGRTVAP